MVLSCQGERVVGAKGTGTGGSGGEMLTPNEVSGKHRGLKWAEGSWAGASREPGDGVKCTIVFDVSDRSVFSCPGKR